MSQTQLDRAARSLDAVRDKRFRVSNEDGDSYLIEAKDLREAEQIAREQEGSRRHTVYEEGDRGPGWGRPRFRDARARATDPPVSEAQRRAMGAAMSGKSNLGIPRSVGKEFINADPGGHLPATAKDGRIAKITGVRAGGDDWVSIEWEDEKGKSGTTSGDPGNTHMQQLLQRAQREGIAGAGRYLGSKDAGGSNRKDRAKKLAESEGFRWDDLSRHEQGVFLGRIMDLEEEEERRRAKDRLVEQRGSFFIYEDRGKYTVVRRGDEDLGPFSSLLEAYKAVEKRAAELRSVNDAGGPPLEEFRRLHEAMTAGEPQDWQWIGKHMSQRMFGISEKRAKEYAQRHGGTASRMEGAKDAGEELAKLEKRRKELLQEKRTNRNMGLSSVINKELTEVEQEIERLKGGAHDAYADPAKYAPYHKMPAFQEGVRAYKAGKFRNPYDPNSVEAQAWDRGLEYGKALQWEEENVGNKDCPLDLAADSLARVRDLYDPRTEGRTYRVTYGGGKTAYVVAKDPQGAARAFRLDHDEPIEGLRDLGGVGGGKDAYYTETSSAAFQIVEDYRKGSIPRTTAKRRLVEYVPAKQAEEFLNQADEARRRTESRDCLGRAADALRAVRARDTRIERDLQDNEPRIVSGVMGVKSKPFQKKFRNQAEMERWMDSDAAGNFDIYEIKAADSARARDVRRPQRPNPPTAEPLRPHPSRIAPPTQVSGFGARGVSGLGDPVYRSGAVPDSVSAREQWDGARRRINY